MMMKLLQTVKIKHQKELIENYYVGRVEFEVKEVQVEVDDLMMAAFPNILLLFLYMAVKEKLKKNVEMEELSLDYLNLEVVLEAFEENLLFELSLVITFQQNQVEELEVNDFFDNLALRNYPNLKDMVVEALQQNALNELNYVEVLRLLMVHHLEFQDNL
jgi:hypothetical protein